MPRKESNTGPISAQAQQDLVSEGIENFELPKSLVTKIAKSAIPEHAKLQKETVLSLVKGSTVFINYLAATAHDVALSKQHKSISASDVLKALEIIEFGDLVDMLQGELQIYREHAKTDKSKKGSANINANASVGPSAIKGKSKDATVSAKAKGKEKDKTIGLPPPFTSAPLTSTIGQHETDSAGPPEGPELTVEEDEEMGEVEEERDGFLEDEEGVVEDDVMEEEEEEEEEEGEGNIVEAEGMQDKFAMEEEELQHDARGLPEPSELESHIDT